ncbi:MAG: mechanosensitive ion channel family protein [Pseudomonadota bacterium]
MGQVRQDQRCKIPALLAVLLRLGGTVMLLAVMVLGDTGPASAQVLDLNSLTTIGQSEEEPLESRPPRQSLPQSEIDAPTAAQYGQLSSSVGPSDYAALEPAQAGRFIDAAERWIRLFKSRTLDIINRTPDALYELSTTLAAASPNGRPSYFLGVAVFAALLLVVGRGIADLFYAFVARPIFVGMQRREPTGYVGKLPVLAYRVLLTFVGLILVVSTAIGVGLPFYEEHDATLLTVVIVFATYFLISLIDTIWRMALAPFLPRYRLVHLTDPEARRLYRWLSAVSAVSVSGSAFCYWVQGLGLPREVHVLVTVTLTLLTIVLLLATMRANLGAINRIITAGRERGEVSWMTLLVVNLWPLAGAGYLLFAWGELVFRLVMGVEAGPERLLVPYALLLLGLMIYAATMYVIERIFQRQRQIRAINAEANLSAEAEAQQRSVEEARAAAAGDSADVDGDGDDEGAVRPTGAENGKPPPFRPERGMRTMEDLARRVASLFAVGAGAYFLLRYWGGDAFFATNSAFDLVQDLIDVVFVGYVVFHAARIWLDQKIQEEGGDEMPAGPLEGEGGGAGASRLATLLPLVRNFILVIIATTVALIVLMELGLNVAPLFAGAGIVGLAIGFGAQTLVRDILSGAFFLLDDAFRKGEYIDVGSVKGTVEKISLRSFQLRHHLGMLHTIPFGEVQFLTNFSRDWVMMKLPLRLTYDTDVEQVRKLVKKLGIQLLDDPVVGHLFLQPLKSQGVIEMEDSAMIVRVKFMTRPGDQWVVRKRVYAEIRTLFEREGVKFAHREVLVRIPDLSKDDEISEEQHQAIGAAARNTIDVVERDRMRSLQATGTDGPVDDR